MFISTFFKVSTVLPPGCVQWFGRPELLEAHDAAFFCAKLRIAYPGKVGKKERVVVNFLYAIFSYLVFPKVFVENSMELDATAFRPPKWGSSFFLCEKKAMASKSPSSEFQHKASRCEA